MSSSNLNMDFLREMGNLCRSGEVPTDVVLVCEGGKEVAAHGLLCAALSPVLRAALRESSTRTVKLEWARADLIEKVLDFACGGDRLSREDAIDLSPIADRLDFASLRSACVSKRLNTKHSFGLLLDVLGDDVLSDVVLPFLDPLDVAGRLELTSRKMRDFLKKRKYWRKKDKEYWSRDKYAPHRSSAKDARTRTIRYCLALNLISEQAAKASNEMDQVVREQSDASPSKLSSDIIFNHDAYEVFVRLADSSSGALLFEGFPEIYENPLMPQCLDLNLFEWALYAPAWPENDKLLSLTMGTRDAPNEECVSLVESMMSKLTVSVVAVNKSTSMPSLVVSGRNFQDCIGPPADGLDTVIHRATCSIDYCFLPGFIHTHGKAEDRNISIGLRCSSNVPVGEMLEILLAANAG